MPPKKIIPLIKDSYLAVIKNSPDTRMYKNFYAQVNGRKRDIMNKGMYSCAFFVFNILSMFDLIKKSHATITSTEKDMQNSGWKKIKQPKIGSVLVWEEYDFGDGDIHRHIGFYMGKNKAISNNYKFGTPQLHHYTLKNKRKIEAIYWHKKLEK